MLKSETATGQGCQKLIRFSLFSEWAAALPYFTNGNSFPAYYTQLGEGNKDQL